MDPAENRSRGSQSPPKNTRTKNEHPLLLHLKEEVSWNEVDEHAHANPKRPLMSLLAATVVFATSLPLLQPSLALAQTPPGGAGGTGQGAVPDILDRVRERDAQLDRLDRERRQAEENRRRANPGPQPAPQPPAPAPQPTPAAEKDFFDKVWEFFFGNEEEENRQRREEFQRRVEEARRQRDEERRRAEESRPPQRQAEAEKPTQPATPVTPATPLPNVAPRTPNTLRTMQQMTPRTRITLERPRTSRQMALSRRAMMQGARSRHVMLRRQPTAAELNAMEARRLGHSAYAAERQREIATRVLSTGLGFALGVGMGRVGGHHRMGGYGRMGGNFGMGGGGVRSMGMGGRMGRY